MSNIVYKITRWWLFWLVWPGWLFAQSAPLDSLQARLDQLQANIAAVRAQKSRLSQQIDSLSAELQVQKQKTGILSRRAVSRQLQRSDRLANEYDRLQHREALLLNELIRTAESGEAWLRDWITRMVQQRPSGEAAMRDWSERLRHVQRLRQRCQAILQQEPPRLTLFRITLQPDDPPEVAQRKIQLLLDQADRLQQLTRQTQKRMAELQNEMTLRQRLAEFMQDIRLTDPATEAVNPEELQGAELATQKADLFAGAARNLAWSDLAAGAFLQIIPEWPVNIAALSDADLQAWIRRLQQSVRHWSATADSLRRRADEMKNRIGRQP
ncbi:MAG: hypothetical protein Q9P90_18405 [candidate division KSB1 bacterium]|nr:hypothetical protein [candidate division KSB1 bacterium]